MWTYASLCALLGVAVVRTQFKIGSDALTTFLDDYLFNATQIGFALVVVWRAVVVRAERAAWLVLGVSMLVWCSGNVLYSVFLPDDIPVPSVADVAWLAAYPGFYVGLWLLVRSRVSRVTRSSVLDGAVVGLAVGAVCSGVVVEAVWRTLGGASVLATTTNLAYPIGDLILLALVAASVVVSGVRPSSSWALLAGGLGVFAAADANYLWETANGASTAGLTSTFWLVGLAMMAASAWLPPRAIPARDGIGGLALLIVGSLTSLGLLAAGSAFAIGALATILAVAALAAVLLRLMLTHGENARLLLQLRREANTDALTGLGNRRCLLDDLQLAINGGRERPMALVVLDLDGFKAFNDRMGHLEGDALLTRLAERLAASVQGIGTAYRMGGDEFCVLTPVDGEPSSLAAKHASTLSEDHPDLPISCSAGAALIPLDGSDLRTVLLVADARMYANKAQRPEPALAGD